MIDAGLLVYLDRRKPRRRDQLVRGHPGLSTDNDTSSTSCERGETGPIDDHGGVQVDVDEDDAGTYPADQNAFNGVAVGVPSEPFDRVDREWGVREIRSDDLSEAHDRGSGSCGCGHAESFRGAGTVR